MLDKRQYKHKWQSGQHEYEPNIVVSMVFSSSSSPSSSSSLSSSSVKLMNLLSFDIENIFGRSGCLCWNFYPNKVQSTAIVVQLFTGSICHVCFSSTASYTRTLADYLNSKAISSILLFCCRIAFISKMREKEYKRRNWKRARKFRCSSRRREKKTQHDRMKLHGNNKNPYRFI